MSLEAFITTYGYTAIGVGTFFEGETILVLAGFATHRGYLQLPWVIVCGFLGTLCGDEFFFYLGRAKGMNLLEKRPYWKSRSLWVSELLNSHPALLVLGFRFLYGLRSLTPLLLGASGFSPLRFFAFNALGALLWAVLIGLGGYFFGRLAESFLGSLEHYELQLFVGLAALGALAWLVHWLRRHKMKSNQREPRS